tara:strand:+ start:1748 stop:1873 length:126 start_codon:yes stop_codon:yes gene_type:complete
MVVHLQCQKNPESENNNVVILAQKDAKTSNKVATYVRFDMK